MANPDFRRYATTPRYDFPGRKGKTYQIQNGNDLLSEYPGAIGVKNGYTTKAKNTLIGAAERNGRRLLAVVMKTDAPSWKKVAKLLDWGFEVGAKVEPVGTLVTPEDVEQARQALVAARLATVEPTTRQFASPTATGVASVGTPTAVVTAPTTSRQVAMLPTLVRRVPLWLWVPCVVFVVLASLRVYAYVRGRRRAVPSPPV
jgi:D-alanyl-D-alanine carboxypeptidase (penicillin-binding protein 5/6)